MLVGYQHFLMPMVVSWRQLTIKYGDLMCVWWWLNHGISLIDDKWYSTLVQYGRFQNRSLLPLPGGEGVGSRSFCLAAPKIDPKNAQSTNKLYIYIYILYTIIYIYYTTIYNII
jgi:hypothetical protein